MQYLFLAGRLEQASGSPAHRGSAIVDGVPRADIVPHAQLPGGHRSLGPPARRGTFQEEHRVAGFVAHPATVVIESRLVTIDHNSNRAGYNVP